MAHWDVFHSDRLELERSLSVADVLAALGRGALTEDDLIRPAGSSDPWARIADRPDLLAAASALAPPPSGPAPAPAPPPPPPPEPPAPPARSILPPTIADLVDESPPEFPEVDDEADFEVLEDDDEPPPTIAPAPAPAPEPPPPASRRPGPYEAAEHDVIRQPPAPPPPDPYGEFDLNLRGAGAGAGGPDRAASSAELLPAYDDQGLDYVDDDGNLVTADGEPAGEDGDEYDPLDEDEEAAEFTLSRGGPEKVEELDLAAMVDVAFQLVLFFLVTATTVLYKTLEVPKPNPESAATAAAAQGRSKSLDDLKDDFILVEIDPTGRVKIDREPVPSDRAAMAERLRAERERSGRKAMLLSADFSTPHRSAVLAYDAANEVGMAIAIARPKPADAAGAPGGAP